MCWGELTVAWQCIFGRESDTSMPCLMLADSRKNERGNENKEAECKDK